MKKLILLLMVIILLPLFLFSQSMIIHLTKGDSTVIELNEIKNISFLSSGNNPDVTPPAEVTNLQATPANSSVTLTWVDPTDADYDHAEITFTPTVTGITQPVTVSKGTRTKVISGLINSVVYTFTVKTVDNSGNKSIGTIIQATPIPPLSVTGKWLNNFSISGTPFQAYTQLTQNGTTLTGTFVFTDGSGFENIGSGSSINGSSITIYFPIGTYSCSFQGTVSNDYQSMSGGAYLGQTYLGVWSATKTGLNKATVSPYDVPMVEKLHELIEKLK
jgi:hypothetical protein